MKITVIICTLLVAQVSASFFDVFQGAVLSVQNSFGKLFSDVVTDVKDTVDCTILAVEHVLSLSEDATARYYEKCGNKNGTVPAPQPKEGNTPILEISIANNEEYLKKELPEEIDARINETLTKFLNGYNPHDELRDVEKELAKETERLADISFLVKQELDKLSKEIHFDFSNIERKDSKPSVDNILEELKLLEAIEQNIKNSSAAEEIHKLIDNVLNKLHAIEVSEASENVKVNGILEDLEKNSNSSYKDFRQQLEDWKAEEARHLDLIQLKLDEHEKQPEHVQYVRANSSNDTLQEPRYNGLNGSRFEQNRSPPLIDKSDHQNENAQQISTSTIIPNNLSPGDLMLTQTVPNHFSSTPKIVSQQTITSSVQTNDALQTTTPVAITTSSYVNKNKYAETETLNLQSNGVEPSNAIVNETLRNTVFTTRTTDKMLSIDKSTTTPKISTTLSMKTVESTTLVSLISSESNMTITPLITTASSMSLTEKTTTSSTSLVQTTPTTTTSLPLTTPIFTTSLPLTTSTTTTSLPLTTPTSTTRLPLTIPTSSTSLPTTTPIFSTRLPSTTSTSTTSTPLTTPTSSTTLTTTTPTSTTRLPTTTPTSTTSAALTTPTATTSLPLTTPFFSTSLPTTTPTSTTSTPLTTPTTTTSLPPTTPSSSTSLPTTTPTSTTRLPTTTPTSTTSIPPTTPTSTTSLPLTTLTTTTSLPLTTFTTTTSLPLTTPASTTRLPQTTLKSTTSSPQTFAVSTTTETSIPVTTTRRSIRIPESTTSTIVKKPQDANRKLSPVLTESQENLSKSIQQDHPKPATNAALTMLNSLTSTTEPTKNIRRATIESVRSPITTKSFVEITREFTTRSPIIKASTRKSSTVGLPSTHHTTHHDLKHDDKSKKSLRSSTLRPSVPTPSLEAFLQYIDRMVGTAKPTTHSTESPIKTITTTEEHALPIFDPRQKVLEGPLAYAKNSDHLIQNELHGHLPQLNDRHSLLTQVPPPYARQYPPPGSFPTRSLSQLQPRSNLPQRPYNEPPPYGKFNNPIFNHNREMPPSTRFLPPQRGYPPPVKFPNNGNRPPDFINQPMRRNNGPVGLSPNRPVPPGKKNNFGDADYDSFFHIPSKNSEAHDRAVRDARKLMEDSKKSHNIMNSILAKKNKGISAFDLPRGLNIGK